MTAQVTLCPRRAAGRRVAGFLLLVCLGACGGGTGDPSRPEGPLPVNTVVAPGTWVVLGSSSAVGVGATPGQGWVARLARTQSVHAVQVQNLARGGSTTYAALPAATTPPLDRPAPDPGRGLDSALALQPSLLILSFPSNDTAAGYAAGETVGNLLTVRQAAAAAGVPTLVLGTQPRNDLAPSQREVLAAIDGALSGELGPCFVPLQPTLAGPTGGIHPDYAAGDGIHLNDAGHALIAHQVQAALDGGLCVRPPGG
ncbi:SGNH/GDSL hydrolase family protein [Rubrivivax albus]|uniref:SGNH/GDSL hydrolase family protein n=1 Tax=Rubrivivax albus TaxID=2499835 RepID=A0A437JRH9_9BURK|nr:SGNH/GDSL hydrolase family protein [Rubrivivax albus]